MTEPRNKEWLIYLSWMTFSFSVELITFLFKKCHFFLYLSLIQAQIPAIDLNLQICQVFINLLYHQLSVFLMCSITILYMVKILPGLCAELSLLVYSGYLCPCLFLPPFNVSTGLLHVFQRSAEIS